MATYIVQGGTTLYRMTQAGVATALTLPSGVTLYGATQPCRFAMMGDKIVVVNGANQDLFITPDDIVRVLQIDPPVSAPTLANSSGTGTDGTYLVYLTFKIKDLFTGQLIAESAPSPFETVTTTTSKNILASTLPLSAHAHVNARGLYITLADGSIYYQSIDLDGNTQTDTDMPTEPVNSLVIPTLGGTPPLLKLVAFWKDRLWAVPRDSFDNVRWTDERLAYSWPAYNEALIPPSDTDTSGVLAIVPRRDDIGFLRKDALWRISGDDNDSFLRQKVDDVGVVATGSIVVVRNVCYFFGRANGRYGVFEWSNDGVRCVSEAQVDTWFNSTTYFNKTYYSSITARYVPETDSVEFLMTNAGDSTQNRWVSFCLRTGAWFGPHQTAEFTPTVTATDGQFSGTLANSTNDRLAVMGSSAGKLYYRDNTTQNDGASAVSLNVDMPFLSAGDPDNEKVWLDFTLHSRIEGAGTLTITPKVGGIGASTSAAISATLTLGREVLRRLGMGRYVQLNLTHNTVSQAVRIFGIEIPYIKGVRR